MNLIGGAQLLGQHHGLQSIQPVRVIRGSGVCIACGLRFANFNRQRSGPLRPSEQALFVQLQRHGKSMRLPRLCKDSAIGLLRRQGHLAATLLGNVFKAQLGVVHGSTYEDVRWRLLNKTPMRPQ